MLELYLLIESRDISLSNVEFSICTLDLWFESRIICSFRGSYSKLVSTLVKDESWHGLDPISSSILSRVGTLVCKSISDLLQYWSKWLKNVWLSINKSKELELLSTYGDLYVLHMWIQNNENLA